jgi:hypothetical protein
MPASTAPATASTAPATARSGPRPSAEAIDLLSTAGTPVLKRLAPVLVGLVAFVVVWRVLRRRS